MPEAPPQLPQDPQFVSKLAYQLVRKNLCSQAKISQVLDEYTHQLEGTSPFAYQIRQEDQTVVGLDRDTGETKLTYRIPLQRNEGDIGWIATSPNYVAVIDETTGRWQKVVERSSSYGLALTGGHGLLSFPPGVVPAGKALHQDQWIFEKIPDGQLTSGPLDLFVSPREGMMVVADRADGQLHLIDPRGGEVLKSLAVRDQPSREAIAVAISAAKPQAFVTDQAGPDLILIEFDVRAARRLPQAHGRLGNLALSPDDKYLYVLRTDPDQAPAVLVIKTADLALEATIPIKGKWFSLLDDPIDLMAISPSGRWLCVMSYVDEPSLVTPALTVVDLRKHEVLDTFVLKEDEKPAALAFLAPEPKKPEKKILTFGEMLVAKKLVDAAILKRVAEEVEKQLAEAQKPAVDEDVAKIIEELIPGSEIKQEEVAELAAPSKQAIDRLVAGDGVDWIANNQLNQGERRAFAQRVADIQADESISRANSALVVHLIRPEEEKEPELPPEYSVPPEEEEPQAEGEAGAAPKTISKTVQGPQSGVTTGTPVKLKFPTVKSGPLPPQSEDVPAAPEPPQPHEPPVPPTPPSNTST